MSTNLVGTLWRRERDGMFVRVWNDADPTGGEDRRVAVRVGATREGYARPMTVSVATLHRECREVPGDE